MKLNALAFFILCTVAKIGVADKMAVEKTVLVRMEGDASTKEVVLRKPAGVSIAETFPVEDFMIAEFSKESKVFMKAYLGNAPAFPSRDCNELPRDETVNGLHRRAVQCEDGNLEVLVDLGVRHDWPHYIHFMLWNSGGLSSDGIRMINSIEVKE